MVNLRGISIRPIAAAVGGLVVAAGGAYYYYVYLPQVEKESAVAAQQAVKPPAGVKAAKPKVAPGPQAASAVPAVSELRAPVSGVAAIVPEQPAVTTPGKVAIATPVQSHKPVLEPAPEPVKPKPAVRKPAPKKPGINTPSTRPAKSQQATSPLPAVLPESGVPAPAPRIATPKYNDVLTAVLRSDRDAVKQLLDLGRWVDKPGSSGLTPLMAAVMNRDAQMVELLLDRGAVPGPQALKLARKNKDDATVSLLEQRGAR